MASVTCPKCGGGTVIRSGDTAQTCWLCGGTGSIDACDCVPRSGLTRSVPAVCMTCGKVVVG